MFYFELRASLQKLLVGDMNERLVQYEPFKVFVADLDVG